MTRILTYPRINALIDAGCFVTASAIKRNRSLSAVGFLKAIALLISLVLAFSSLISAGEDSALLDKGTSTQTEERIFEMAEIKWDDFSFKIPVPIGETYRFERGEDVEGGDLLDVTICHENHCYLILFLSSRSFRKDYGELYRDMKRRLLLCEQANEIEDVIAMSLSAQTVIPGEFKRIEKVCDSDQALIYQAEVQCDFKQYSRNTLAAIGIMKHDSYSYYFLCINVYADIPGEWEKFHAWNKHLSGVQ